MRILAFVLAVLGFTAVIVAGSLAIAVWGDGDDPTASTVASAGLALALTGPLLLGSLAAYWQMRGGSDAGRHYRQWRTAAVATTGVGVVLVLWGGIAAGVPLWLPVVVAVVAISLLVVAVPLGDRIRRSADAGSLLADDPGMTDDRGAVRRTARTAALAFMATLLVAVAAWVALTSASEESLDLRFALALLAFPFVAGSIACLPGVMRLGRRVRAICGDDFGRVRAVSRVVLRGKSDQLDDAGRLAAARYAHIAPVVLGTQVLQQGLLLVGLSLNAIGQVLADLFPPVLLIPFVALIVLALAVLVPLHLSQIRRARAYAADHGDPRSTTPLGTT